MSRNLLFVLSFALPTFSQDQAGVMKPADEKLMITPGLPECMKGIVMRGDPAHGAYVIYAKASAGCDAEALSKAAGSPVGHDLGQLSSGQDRQGCGGTNA